MSSDDNLQAGSFLGQCLLRSDLEIFIDLDVGPANDLITYPASPQVL